MTDSKCIQDYSEYNAAMKKSLLDKIFFMDKIDANVIVDYGCADGTLIHFLYSLFSEFTYIGYDIDTTMLTHATSKFKKEILKGQFRVYRCARHDSVAYCRRAE